MTKVPEKPPWSPLRPSRAAAACSWLGLGRTVGRCERQGGHDATETRGTCHTRCRGTPRGARVCVRGLASVAGRRAGLWSARFADGAGAPAEPWCEVRGMRERHGVDRRVSPSPVIRQTGRLLPHRFASGLSAARACPSGALRVGPSKGRSALRHRLASRSQARRRDRTGGVAEPTARDGQSREFAVHHVAARVRWHPSRTINNRYPARTSDSKMSSETT